MKENNIMKRLFFMILFFELYSLLYTLYYKQKRAGLQSFWLKKPALYVVSYLLNLVEFSLYLSCNVL